MAFIRFKDGTGKSVAAEQGIEVWKVLNGEQEPQNDRQKLFIQKVDRIHLNPENAPASYLAKHGKEKGAEEVWWQK